MFVRHAKFVSIVAAACQLIGCGWTGNEAVNDVAFDWVTDANNQTTWSSDSSAAPSFWNPPDLFFPPAAPPPEQPATGEPTLAPPQPRAESVDQGPRLNPPTRHREVSPSVAHHEPAAPPAYEEPREFSPPNPPPISAVARQQRIDATRQGPPVEETATPNMSAAAAPVQSVLPWAERPVWDDYQVAVFAQADEAVRQGFMLARKGAVFSARAELLKALHRIAAALDARLDRPVHQPALRNGLLALDEAADFANFGAGDFSPERLATIISPHQTPVLRERDLATLTADRAIEIYGEFAREQLAIAANRVPVASMALHGLAALTPLLRSGSQAAADHQELALAQAALMADDRNFLAANRLASKYVKYGQFAEAKALLQRSLAVSPEKSTWRQLAALHGKLGEARLEKIALQRAAQPEKPNDKTPGRHPIVWMDPAEFVRNQPANNWSVGATSLGGTASLAESTTSTR